MKMLTVFVLVCATVVLARADDEPPSDSSSSCPANWTESNGRCLYYVRATLTWAKAEKNCQSMGANLASVHNADENYDIQTMIAKITQAFGRTWLGGSDCQNEGIWLWSDGTSFNYRHCGTFDNRFWRQHCLQMNYGENKCWDDVQCSSELPSVCAKVP